MVINEKIYEITVNVYMSQTQIMVLNPPPEVRGSICPGIGLKDQWGGTYTIEYEDEQVIKNILSGAPMASGDVDLDKENASIKCKHSVNLIELLKVYEFNEYISFVDYAEITKAYNLIQEYRVYVEEKMLFSLTFKLPEGIDINALRSLHEILEPSAINISEGNGRTSIIDFGNSVNTNLGARPERLEKKGIIISKPNKNPYMF